jgi:hypothetical protein
MHDERVGAAVPDIDRLVDEIVGLGGLLGDCVDGVLENLSLSACHAAMVRGGEDRSRLRGPAGRLHLCSRMTDTPKPVADTRPTLPNGEAGGFAEAGRAEPEKPSAEPVEPAAGKWTASIFPGDEGELPRELSAVLQKLQERLELPVWLLVQSGREFEGLGDLNRMIYATLFSSRHELPETGQVALVIDSPGGYAKAAFQIASLFRQHGEGFVAVVPRYAKSAATLVTLGAESLLLGEYGELGPLDAQFIDAEREDVRSALDEVHSLERLNAFAMAAVDELMTLLLNRTGKKVDTVLPHALRFVADMSRPLFEKIDTVHYTQVSRVLKEAEEYAVRLLIPKYSLRDAQRIARHLVEHYPVHDFVIDRDEAEEFGLEIADLEPQTAELLNEISDNLVGVTALGRFQEVTSE